MGKTLPPPPADDNALLGWVTLDDVDLLWPQVGDVEPDALPTYLLAAHEACVEFLNRARLAEPETISTRWKLAQVLQARALARSFAVGDGGMVGPDGEAVTVYPMDWTVKHLLRPKRARRYVR